MTIDPKRVKEIFLEAADLPDEAARVAYLDRSCGGDAGLRARVEVLLRSHDPEGSFLGTPAAVVPDPNQAATRTSADGAGASDDEPLTFLAPPTRRDALGRIGHYEVLLVLGRGAFGIVFRALDNVLHRVVALKVLSPQVAATSPARKRFLREARSSAQVRHENVVQVYEVGEQPLPFLVMEFIPGETLQQKLDRVGPLDVPETVRIGRQIAEGLAAAHDHDLIHRDIKPGNVLLESGPHGHAKITDFGLARAADDASISQSGIVAGTPMYMAPEQAQGKPLDHRADLFSLGSVLYQMVSGRPPFRASTMVAVLKRVAEDQPRAIREIIPETPQWLCDIIAKLHAKNPDDRYQTPREVADVLADCEAQLEASSKLKDFSRIPRGKPASSGKWKCVAAAAVLLLPVIALAVTELAGVTHLVRGQQPTSPLVAKQDPPAADTKVADTGGKEPDPKQVPEEKKSPPPDPKPPVEVAPPTPTVHDTWIKATALLPLDQQAEAVAAKMQEQLPGFEEAFLKAIPAMSAERQALLVGVWLKERKPVFASPEDAWPKAMPNLAAGPQVVLLAAWLKQLNHAYDGTLTHKAEGNVITSLEIPSRAVQDLTPLRVLSGLKTLVCRDHAGWDNKAESDAAVLQSLKALETINGKPAAQFWKDAAARQAEFREWLRLVPTLTAKQQVAVVAAKLKERNPTALHNFIRIMQRLFACFCWRPWRLRGLCERRCERPTASPSACAAAASC
jgi:serine/threonine protein kinase